ncbi:hypothetical protein [Paraburkholderia phenoliruptrix]|uniref:hypothetical protein n=1 Tax=Paraburkholderia phenoliruptrix TaxID=252970 RepID=UPI002866E0FD|nr:hypothetical protein [Paraburkholderia phenoliruptrix]MDR6393049.1 hypothetical protein [Paraburkholderia phenoliruptrix]
MKKLILAVLLAAFSIFASATTLNPVQLLNPAGSSSGQTIVSTGASTAPGWGNVPVANVTGAAPSASPTFTGSAVINSSAVSGNILALNASSNTASGAAIFLTGNGATTPSKYIRVFGGHLQCVNSANSTVICDLDDSGNLTLPGTLTATGITGTTSGAAPAASDIGSVNQQTFSSVNITTSNTNQNLTSITVGAGVWDITCNVLYAAAATTTTNALVAGVSTTSATLPSGGNYSQLTANFPTNAANSLICPVQRINVTTNTTVYLVGLAIFGTSTMSATGFLRALRVH